MVYRPPWQKISRTPMKVIVKKKQKKTNRQQFSTVFTVIDHRNVVSSKLKHFDVISMIDNSIQTMENCCRFVNFGKRGRLEMVLD